MPMPLKAMMARKTRRKPISNAYAFKSDDGEQRPEENQYPMPMPLKAMMANKDQKKTNIQCLCP
jgi:hypothetical protein